MTEEAKLARKRLVSSGIMLEDGSINREAYPALADWYDRKDKERAISKEDIKFLKDLQHELNTQVTDGQADPRYWVIIQQKERPAPEGCGAPRFYVGDCGVFTREDFIEQLEDEYISDEQKEAWSEVDKNDMDEIQEFAVETLKIPDVSIVYVTTEDVLTGDSNCFLTKKACKEHIEKYWYNYTRPRTYALTAFRNKEFERVLNILSKTDWDKVESAITDKTFKK